MMMRNMTLIVVVGLFLRLTVSCTSEPSGDLPYWLSGYEDLYKESPRKASQHWFKEAKFGMFVHLNLASLCENGKADYLLWARGDAPAGCWIMWE